jgi:hypothetical protein
MQIVDAGFDAGRHAAFRQGISIHSARNHYLVRCAGKKFYGIFADGKRTFAVCAHVRNDNRRPKLVKLIATCGPLDMDGPQPAITVMMPDED